MRAEQRRTATDQRCHDPATRIGLRDAVNAPEEQRMMGDQELRTTINGFPRDIDRWVDGEQNMPDRHIRVADGEAHHIPRLCPG